MDKRRSQQHTATARPSESNAIEIERASLLVLDGPDSGTVLDLAHGTAVNDRTLIAGLAGIEALLAEPPADEGALARMIGWEVGWVLPDESDAGARAWLRSLADMLREELGDRAPPARGT